MDSAFAQVSIIIIILLLTVFYFNVRYGALLFIAVATNILIGTYMDRILHKHFNHEERLLLSCTASGFGGFIVGLGIGSLLSDPTISI